MSKIIFDGGISLDGFFAGDNRSSGKCGPEYSGWFTVGIFPFGLLFGLMPPTAGQSAPACSFNFLR